MVGAAELLHVEARRDRAHRVAHHVDAVGTGRGPELVGGAGHLACGGDVRLLAVVRDREHLAVAVPGVVQALLHDPPAAARAVEAVHEQHGVAGDPRDAAGAPVAVPRAAVPVPGRSPSAPAGGATPNAATIAAVASSSATTPAPRRGVGRIRGRADRMGDAR